MNIKHQPATALPCEVVMRRNGQDVRCNRPALSQGRCKRHGGEMWEPELITHRALLRELGEDA